jgi:hypothetical protein
VKKANEGMSFCLTFQDATFNQSSHQKAWRKTLKAGL